MTTELKADYAQFRKIVESFSPKLLDIEGIGWQKDLNRFAESFFEQGVTTASVDVNANVRSTNMYTFISEFPKIYLKEYALYNIWRRMVELFGEELANEMVKQEITGGIYIHDLFHAGLLPYCFAYSLGEIVRKGLQFIENLKSVPAKHLNTFIQHVIQFVMFASNQSSGAVGLPDLFVWMWYYVKKDLETGYIPKEDWRRHVEQAFQVFTYSINQPIRGTQSPYVNVTYLDRNYITTIFKNEVYPDGSKITDELENIIALQKMYWEWISKEREKQMFTFPVMTASLLYKDGRFLDEDSARFINRVNLKWQDTNWYISDSIDAVASCCRLQSSMSAISFGVNKLKGMMNSIGGSDLNIGSFKVITINLPRIALEAKHSIAKFFEILKERVELVTKTLAAIRSLLKENIDKGLLPLYTHQLMSLERQFGTVGITGVWEAASILSDKFVEVGPDGIKYSKAGEGFVSTLLDQINEELDNATYELGFSFNVEQVPAEKAAFTLAEKDKLMYNVDFTIYSNQWIPLFVESDVLNRIRYSSLFDKKVGGGAILHINIDPINDEEYMWNFVNKLAELGVKYFAFNTKISVCEYNHAFYGNVCPMCGKPAQDFFTRIVGYLVPSKAFNAPRRKYDLPNRQFYYAEHLSI